MSDTYVVVSDERAQTHPTEIDDAAAMLVLAETMKADAESRLRNAFIARGLTPESGVIHLASRQATVVAWAWGGAPVVEHLGIRASDRITRGVAQNWVDAHAGELAHSLDEWEDLI